MSHDAHAIASHQKLMQIVTRLRRPLEETKKGIAYDNSHESKDEKKNR